MSLSHAARYSESWGSLIHISNVAFISDRGHWHRTLNWIWRFVTCFPMPAINLAISASSPRTFSYDRIGSAAFISCCIASNMWLDSRNASLKWRSSASPIIGFWLSVLPLCNTIVWFLSLKWASMEASGNKWEQVHCFGRLSWCVLIRHSDVNCTSQNVVAGCKVRIQKVAVGEIEWYHTLQVSCYNVTRNPSNTMQHKNYGASCGILAPRLDSTFFVYGWMRSIDK